MGGTRGATAELAHRFLVESEHIIACIVDFALGVTLPLIEMFCTSDLRKNLPS